MTRFNSRWHEISFKFPKFCEIFAVFHRFSRFFIDFSCCHVRYIENKSKSLSSWRDSWQKSTKQSKKRINTSLFSLFLSLYYVKTARERSRARRFTQQIRRSARLSSSSFYLFSYPSDNSFIDYVNKYIHFYESFLWFMEYGLSKYGFKNWISVLFAVSMMNFSSHFIGYSVQAPGRCWALVFPVFLKNYWKLP